MSTDSDRFGEAAAWAGESADSTVGGTQSRISRDAQVSVDGSPAEYEPEYDPGSQLPGAELALGAMRKIDYVAGPRCLYEIGGSLFWPYLAPANT